MVVVVIDQMRRTEIARLGPHFTGGFRGLLNEGARLDGHYGQQNTYTGPGHALILSGSYGYLNGIFQNNWWLCTFIDVTFLRGLALFLGVIGCPLKQVI